MFEIPIHVVGRLTADPVRSHGTGGTPQTRITVEVVERLMTPQGWRRAGLTRLECCACAELGVHVFDSLRAGDRVVAVGRLRQRGVDGCRRDYDVVLDDIGASLRSANVWPVPAGDDVPGGGIVFRDERPAGDATPGEAGA